MVRLYDFGADTKSVVANERKAIAWPVAVWSCYIPENETQDINILEHLILQLVNKGYNNPKSILCSNVGFNKELVEASIESCRNSGYFDKRYKELVLSKDGKSVLGTVENPYDLDLEASKKSKKIYMIQDLVTKSVVPVFNIDKLPQYYVEDPTALEIHYENFYGKKPRSASQKTAIRYWARLCHNKRKGLIEGSNIIDLSESPLDDDAIEDFIPFEDEVDWESIQDDELINGDDVRSLAEAENEKEQQNQENSIKSLTIIDDSPEMYWARGYIAINRNAPDEVIIISPFGESLDDWFRTVINRIRACDNTFEDEIQFFLMEKREELKDTIAFGNDLNIALFNEYPFICNDPVYKAVKTSINRLTTSKMRFQQGEDDTLNYAQALRTAYEASLRLVVKNNSYLFNEKNIDYDEYKNNLRMLVNSYSFLKQEIYDEYKSYNMYKNMTETNEDKGFATAFLALFLMDAWSDRNGKSMDLFRNMPDLPIKIKEYTSFLVSHNRNGAGNIASHGGDEIADLKFSEQQAIRQYQEFEDVFRALYNRFMEV